MKLFVYVIHGIGLMIFGLFFFLSATAILHQGLSLQDEMMDIGFIGGIIFILAFILSRIIKALADELE